MKTINARFRENAAEELRHSAAGHPDVEFVDDYLEPGQKAALIVRDVLLGQGLRNCVNEAQLASFSAATPA